MQALQLVVIVLIGLSLGVVGAQARVPNLKRIPYLSFVVLMGGSYTALLVGWRISPLEACLFVIVVAAGNALYGGKLWEQLALEPGLTYWAWVKRDFLHTRYLRRLYRSRRTADSSLA